MYKEYSEVYIYYKRPRRHQIKEFIRELSIFYSYSSRSDAFILRKISSRAILYLLSLIEYFTNV